MKTRAFGGVLAAVICLAAAPAFSQSNEVEVRIDRNLAALSLPHVQVCQQGFERLFGVPEGTDPDTALMIGGVTQMVVENPPQGDLQKSVLEILMPYERMLPGGARVSGTIICAYGGSGASFDTVPEGVSVVEGEETRSLSGAELALFR